jgi:hypothetical protein
MRPLVSVSGRASSAIRQRIPASAGRKDGSESKGAKPPETAAKPKRKDKH